MVWDGYIADGHNRYDIIKKHNLTEYRVVEKKFADIDEAKIWIKKNQLARRNLTPYLRAEYLLDIAEWEAKRKQAKENQVGGTSVSIDTKVDVTQDLATKLGIGRDNASRIIQIHLKAPDEIKDKCRTGEMSINEAFMEIKKGMATLKLPPGKYRTIVIDPPWSVQQSQQAAQESTPDYPVMSLDEIRNLPIKNITDKDCHIYMWTTHESLPAALSLLKSWGINYKYLFTWVKKDASPENWKFSTELCLFGAKGKFERKKEFLRVDFNAEAGEGLLKPQCFYEAVKFLSPEPRIDLFSHEPHEGFTAWDPRSENPEE